MPPLILLAAGRSLRMGVPKGLLLWEGRPWIEAQLDRLEACGGEALILVLGRDRGRYREALSWLPIPGAESPHGAVCVALELNPRPERGQLSSLQVGLSRLPPGSQALVCPIDVPLSPSAVQALLLDRELGDQREHARVPIHRGRGGHPVWLSAAAVHELRALDPERARLDHYLCDRSAKRLEVQDPEVVLDLDTPERWEAFRRRAPPRGSG